MSGLVYASQAISAAAGDPIVGALVMTAFGMGTGPEMEMGIHPPGHQPGG